MSRLQQAHAAQNERAHDALAKLRFLHHQSAQIVRRDDQGIHGRSATASTSAGAPESSASSAENEPALCVTMFSDSPNALCWLDVTSPDRITNMPGATSPAL